MKSSESRKKSALKLNYHFLIESIRRWEKIEKEISIGVLEHTVQTYITDNSYSKQHTGRNSPLPRICRACSLLLQNATFGLWHWNLQVAEFRGLIFIGKKLVFKNSSYLGSLLHFMALTVAFREYYYGKKILKILMYSTSGPVLNVETRVLNVGTRVLKPGKIPCTRTQRTTTPFYTCSYLLDLIYPFAPPNFEG